MTTKISLGDNYNDNSREVAKHDLITNTSNDNVVSNKSIHTVGELRKWIVVE